MSYYFYINKLIGDKLLTVGQKFPVHFSMQAVKPFFNEPEENGESAFINVNSSSFGGKWRIFYFYPKDFTFVCPTEIFAFGQLKEEFDKRDTVLLGGSPDNEYVKLAWRNSHSQLKGLNHYSFADASSRLAQELGIIDEDGITLRATFIVDPNNVIQHVSVTPDKVGRNPIETLRILDALQSNELSFCNRPIGGSVV